MHILVDISFIFGLQTNEPMDTVDILDQPHWIAWVFD